MNTPSRWSTEKANEWYAQQPWLVAGKTNTIYQWQDLNPVKETVDLQVGPEIWFHDLFSADGTPYDRTEIEIFKKYTAVRRLSSSGVAFPELAPN
jgi:hypothetical protein